jgi:hypothetical protein
MRAIPLRRGAALLPLVVVLVACAVRDAGGSSPSPIPSNGAQPSAGPSDAPTEPGASPSSVASPSSSPTADPTTPPPNEIGRFDRGAILRSTADGVAVRARPDLDAELVEGYDQGSGTRVENLTLLTGDEVGMLYGPIVSDGHTWYAVQHSDVRAITFDVGWVAADFLTQVDTRNDDPVLLAMDGLGTGAKGVGQARAGAGLVVNVAVTPMPDQERCEAEVILTGTDGRTTTLAGGEITETLTLFSGPLENSAAIQREAGEFTLEVRTDCSWAGMVVEPQV